MKVEKVAVVGLGVIGGSIVKALNNKGFKGKIVAFDKNEDNFTMAMRQGFLDNTENKLDVVLDDADVVFVATPLGAYKSVFMEMKPFLKDGVIITDVGSVKKEVHDIFDEVLGNGFIFIGGHPMAGSEKSGFEHATGHMFENAYYFLTTEDENSQALEAVCQLVDLMDAKAKVMEAGDHDKLVSKTSHMPHITAALLVDLLSEDESNLMDFVGGGFRDTTRIASGLPSLWRDILIFNRTEIVNTMESHIKRLSEMKEMLEAGDQNGIFDLLASSKSMRENIPKHLSDAIEKELAIYLDVEDKPGIIAEAAQTLADNKINIKDIEIIHARENIPGVLKIGFYNEKDYLNAKVIFEVA